MKILIIDDEEDVRRIAHLSLTHVGGHEVIEAAGGAAGIDKARAERPDAILLDVMMPAMDGPATLAQLQADESTRAIPVVFVTARAMTAEIERFRSLGARGVLIKPFDAMTLPQDLAGVLA
jgi:two-component system alkaline phosphatase synthesis response regulator PhoP